jgi:hypothetical protein
MGVLLTGNSESSSTLYPRLWHEDGEKKKPPARTPGVLFFAAGKGS